MTIWRSGLLALAVATGMAAGASLAAADGLPDRDGYRGADGGAQWPNIPWRTWQGLYGGVHAGSADAFDDDGLVGGVQLGRNWQAGNIVYGLEGDVSLSGLDFVEWMGTVRGRLGYLLSPGILVYGTAGVGLVDFEDDGTESDLVYGLGIEGRLTEATTVRLEYLGFDDTEVDVVRAGLNFKLNW